RFSEVEWLKRTLEKSSSLTSNLPPFPSKRVFISRFNRDFLEKRRALLEEFLTRLVNTTTYLSESALHLFLQTNLKVKEIERILEGKDCRNITDFVSQEEHLDGRVLRQKSTCTDSGFSGSTNLDRHLPGRTFTVQFILLQCSRNSQRRKRTFFTNKQLNRLEEVFQQERFPGIEIRDRLTDELGIREDRIQTKNRAFLLYNSCVRRRFSEVEWLKRTLEKSSSLTSNLPPFPSKRVFISRFNRDFLEKRRALLEEFLT
ncbi:hypothetical protein QZH41_015113, partial [Actinostola sp. cb2023]